jgi:thiol:disulfide interchange protein DsbD
MPRIARAAVAFAGIASLFAAVIGPAAPAVAGEEPKATFAARIEPKAVAPGGQGTLIVKGTFAKDLHVYADAPRFQVKPEAAPGVEYGEPKILTPPKPWKDPLLEDEPAEDVWFDSVELSIPFTLAANAPPDVKVGVHVVWNGCDAMECFFKVKASASANVPRPAPIVVTNGSGETVRPGDPVHPVAPPRPAPDVVAKPSEGAPAPAPKEPQPATTIDHKAARVEVFSLPGRVRVRFSPRKGYHLYAPGSDTPENQIAVSGVAAEGVAWGAAFYPSTDSVEIQSPVDVDLPHTLTGPGPHRAMVRVQWAGCTDDGECERPEDKSVAVNLTAVGSPTDALPPAPPAPAPSAAEPPKAGATATDRQRILFPEVRHGATFGETTAAAEKSLWQMVSDSDIQGLWERLGILILLPVFVLGIGLAFTPCVLPIIPITVSIIGGGRSDLSKSRLTFLLSTYVVGLSLAFGSMGLIAALTGGSISAAFESTVALWVISSIFVLLSFGMFGVYELQPPQFLQRLQGGAKGGSAVGAFAFGALSAVIASPCTGPVIVAMLVFTAQAGNAVIGLFMFMTLGLGMGAVFFAAGSLNLLMRPGPWMVWVRYGFGVLLVAIALYYLASAGRLSPTGVFVGGFVVAALVGVGIARHLVKAEGEALQPAAVRGGKAAVAVVAATLVVALLTRRAEETTGWITIRDRDHMVAEVEKAKKAGQATVFDVWGTWCHYCKVFDEVIEDDPVLRDGFKKMKTGRLDITEDQRTDLRDGIGIGPGQPILVFLDKEGRIHRDMDLRWPGGKDLAREELRKRLRTLGVIGSETASASK